MTPALLRRRPARTTDQPPPAAVTPPAHAPDWSAGTLDLLARLRPLERAFAEWFASGLSAAAAYRKAAGRDPGPGPDTSRQEGYKLRSRPRVRAAIQACLSDRTLGARLDREAILGKLCDLILRCEDSARPRDRRILVAALVAVARLQGFLPGRRPPPRPAAGPPAAADAPRRLDELILRAEQAIAGPTAGARGGRR